ncbi:hypothetical protein ACFWZ2_09885 [Streptomyces sp. NPDC059002]|uniref:hypothetical protein n=1 Tax=Streptomyces sp. NPDC059002 TaxID=3346690 RepID=UPI0036C68C11
MARHAAPTSPRPGSRALLRAGLTVTAAGAALAGGAATASAVEPLATTQTVGFSTPVGDFDAATPGQALTEAVHRSTAGGLAPAKTLQLDPLAGTGVDPLDNSLGTQIADFKPVSTAAATGPLAEGGSLEDMPLVGPAAGLLPG